MRPALFALVSLVSACLPLVSQGQPTPQFLSHPPVRPLPTPGERPVDGGPAWFVDPVRGDDAAGGTKEHPWRTLAHGVKQLRPGQTLLLRGGTYYEHVLAQLFGTIAEPITIRGYPGELVILDGGLREFFDHPAASWEPCPGGAAGEFWSKKAYPGLALEAGDGPAVFGNFGDSWIPLQAYRFHGDLRSDNPFWNVANKVGGESFVYCGPGVFYDPTTGHIHCRLAHTKLSGLGDDNYRGETDPRKLPLVIAGGDRPPLELRKCQNVRLFDLVLRGSRVPTLQVHDCRNIELDGVHAYGGNSAMQVLDTHGFRMDNSACRGIGAPWTFRGMLKYRSVEARLFTGNRWDPSGNDNRDFQICMSEFTDSVDGIFIGNVRGVRFSHNLVENITDDGIFLTAGTGYDGETWGGDIHICQNRFARILTTFAFGVGHGRQKMTEKGKQTGTGVWIYRNVFDLRQPVWYTWPSGLDAPQEITSRGRFASDHGGPTWEPMWIYHNTILAGGTPRYDYGCDGLIHGLARGTSRRVYNNIVCLTEGIPGTTLPKPDANFDADGNLFWSLQPDKPLSDKPFAKFQASEAYVESQKRHPPGWTTHDRQADPQFRRIRADWRESVNLNLRDESPAIAAGILLPEEWPGTKPARPESTIDIGALRRDMSWDIGIDAMWNTEGGRNTKLKAPWFRQSAAFEPQPDRNDDKRPRARIVEGYPAFDAPIIAYLLRKSGWEVETIERVWFDLSELSGPAAGQRDREDHASRSPFTLLVYDGSLARAKADKTAFDAADLTQLKAFLDCGGTLLITRERADLFAAPEGRKFLEELIGVGTREPNPAIRVRQPDHPWLKSLAGATDLPWLAKGSPLRTSKGESLIGSDAGASLLHRVPVGKGQFVYLGWSPAASIPHGRETSTPQEEEAFERQVTLLREILRSASDLSDQVE